jgi:Tfp pilus assembly protein PilN
MIKINLCPIDELESPYWWVPDVAAVVVIATAAFFAVQWHLGQIQDEIDEVKASVDEITANEQKLAADLRRYDNMEKDERELETKLAALQSITVSKIGKYMPLIVVEHLANLRPEGIWYHYFKVDESTGKTFELKGQGFDNLLVAELMTALKSTASQEADDADLRTLVYFDNVLLDQTGTPQQAPAGFPELGVYPEFMIRGEFLERGKSGGGRGKGSEADAADLMTTAKPRDAVFRM